MEKILQHRYRVVRALGRGGRGAVYLCDDMRLPGKQWAIKQMQPPEVGLEQRFRAAFERESATLSRLRHPNLPAVVDSFEDDGEAYLVMEYVDGENMAEHVRRRDPLPELEAFRHGLTLCGLLELLHGQNPPLIFRDLKPENVMRNGEGILKLVDFGLARRFVPGRRSDTVPTGSVGYAAPEQWEDVSQTDERSDIYSWGATLVTFLTGKIPSPQFPTSALRVLDPPLSPAGTAILARCLKPRPGERYASAAALREDLERYLAAPPALALRHGDDAPRLASRPATTREPASPAPEPRPAPRRSEAPSRFAWRAVSLPLVLLVLATTAFLAAIATQAPRVAVPASRSASAPAVSGSPLLDAVGVAPYRPRGTAWDKVEEARRLYAGKRWAEAIDVLDQATTRFPEDGAAHILKENAYIRLTGAPFFRLPFICSLSGVDGEEGVSDVQGMALAQATVNARGGLRGRRFVVDCYDDRSSTARCLQIAERLVEDPHTLVVMGPMNSQRTLAVAPIFNAARVNLVAPTASARKIWQSGPCIFTASESRGPRVRALARYAARSGHRRVAGLADGTSRLSAEMMRIFRTELTADGGTFAALPAFQENQKDFHEQVEQVAVTHPDMIFFADYRGAPLGRFATQLRRRGLATPICAQTTSMEPMLVDVGGPYVDGVLLSESYHPRSDAPLTRAFVAAFHRKFGSVTPTYPAAENFDAFNAVVSALKTTRTRAGLNAFFHASGVTRPAFEGVSGRFALGRCLDARPVWLIEVRHGRFHLMGKGAADTR